MPYLKRRHADYLLRTNRSLFFHHPPIQRRYSPQPFLEPSFYPLPQRNKPKLFGLKLILAGCLKRTRRSQYIVTRIGKTPTSSFSSKIDYAQLTALTKAGIFGIKVWLHYQHLRTSTTPYPLSILYLSSRPASH
jgi:hypothetical protein